MNDFLVSEFGFGIERSNLKVYPHFEWIRFCSSSGFDVNSEGLFVPKTLTAYLNGDSTIFVSNLYHELFGHGLFCEHSLIGKQLEHLDDKKANKFLYEKIPEDQLLGLADRNIWNYEGFALWLERLLCLESHNAYIWLKKREGLPNEYLNLLDLFRDAEMRLTRFGFMSQLGFPKSYDGKKLVEVLRQFYKEKFENIDLIILYGSQKPDSDVDLLIVSNNQSQNYFNGWLDIYELNVSEFETLIKLMDISVTDPLFSGKLIYGSASYYETLKQRLLAMPITREAVGHNLYQAERQKKEIPSLKTQREVGIAYSYIESFTKTAKALNQNKKLLTLRGILDEEL